MEKQINQIQIEISDDVAQGNYSNLVIVSHSPSEFIIDFVKIVPAIPKSKVVSRIIMTPDRAKAFLKALQENIAKYESVFGTIKINDVPMDIPPINFRTGAES